MHDPTTSALERAVAWLCQAVLWLTMMVIFVILTANTLLRYSTGGSLQWANELPELLFPWLVMAGVVLAALHGSHIATTFLMDSVAPPIRRAVATVGWLLVAAMYLLLTWHTWNLLEIVADERSPILGVPGSVTYGCMAGGMLMLALLALQSAWRSVRGLSAVPLPATEAEAAAVRSAQG